MVPQLSRRFAALERRKADLLERLHAYSPAQLDYAPAPGAWSALQILDHLVLTETGILEAMIRSLPHRHPVPSADRVKGLLLELLFYTPVRVKAPSRAAHIFPKNTLPLEAHAAAWDFVRRRMSETLEQVGPQTVAASAFQHPVSGRMDVPQTLRFLAAHIVHHNFQLRRHLRAAHGR